MRVKPMLSIMVAGAAFADTHLFVECKSPKGNRGLGFMKKGLFDVKPLNVCPKAGPTAAPAPAPGQPLEVDLNDPALANEVPAEPEDSALDEPKVKKSKARSRKGFRTLKTAQFFCASDVQQLCGDIVDKAKANPCPGQILQACQSCFANLDDPRKVNATCLCDCQQKTPAIATCFKQGGSDDGKGKDKDKGKRELKGQGKKAWDDVQARAELADALLRVRDCFVQKFDQVSDLCKKSLDKRFREDKGEIAPLPGAPAARLLRERGRGLDSAPTQETVAGALEDAYDDILDVDDSMGVGSILALVAGMVLFFTVGGHAGLKQYRKYQASQLKVAVSSPTTDLAASKDQQGEEQLAGSKSTAGTRTEQQPAETTDVKPAVSNKPTTVKKPEVIYNTPASARKSSDVAAESRVRESKEEERRISLATAEDETASV